MQVIVADNCGFCPGVRNAISMAEKVLETQKTVYSLGQLIHNKDVVDELADKGLKTVENVDEIHNGTVLIRSHGAAPAQIEQLKKRGLNIIDATCVLVKRVQKLAAELASEGYKIVVIGDENHPEVKAVVGCANDVVVIGSENDIHKLPEDARLGILGQTTQGHEQFGKIVGAIAAGGFRELKIINTLCRETINRQKAAIKLCKQVDVMFVLGGLNSANTRKLVELCKMYNPQTFHLQNWSEFDKRMVFHKQKAGVTAGASTPDWIIDEFVENLREIR